MKLLSPVLFCTALAAVCAPGAYAQAVSNSGTLRGTVSDPSNAIISGATIQIQNPVSGFSQTAVTDSSGNFQITNIPYNNYHLTANAAGFQTFAQDIDVRSPIPMDLKIGLKRSAFGSLLWQRISADAVLAEAAAAATPQDSARSDLNAIFLLIILYSSFSM